MGNSSMSRTGQALGLLAWLALCFLASGLGAIASVNAGGFYAELARPDWAPPASVFGPVWSLLYAMMAVAAWRVWRLSGWRGARLALGVFVAQLAVNALWSWVFFAWRLGRAALADIVVLWCLIGVTLWCFWRRDRWAAVLLLPYWAWVSFAGVLNYTLWQTNPGLL